MARAERPAFQALDASGVEHLIGYLLAVADVPVRRAFHERIGQPFGLRPVEFTLLVLLRDNGGATPSQIAAALRMPPPHVTKLVDRLARRGWLQRQRRDDDGRALDVVLTGDGEALADAAHAASLSMEEGLLAALAPSERGRLHALLLKLARSSSRADAA